MTKVRAGCGAPHWIVLDEAGCTVRSSGDAFAARGLPAPAARDVLATLPAGEFLLVRPGASPVTFRPPARAVAHTRHRRKYAEKTAGPDRSFLFRAADGRIVATASSVTEFSRTLDAVSPAVLGAHAERGDFSRWVRDVFDDPGIATRLGGVERRWRRRQSADLVASLRAALAVPAG